MCSCLFVVCGTKRAHSLHRAAEVDPDAQRGDVTEEGGSGGRSAVVEGSHPFHLCRKKKKKKKDSIESSVGGLFATTMLRSRLLLRGELKRRRNIVDEQMA